MLKLEHDFHVHTHLSSCAKDSATIEHYVAKARELGIKKLGLADHMWDAAVSGAPKWYIPQNFEHISRAKPLPTAEGIEFFFGCETDMDKYFTVGVSKERFDEFDFIIIPTTHLHMTGFTLTEEDAQSNERRAELWVERFEKLLELDLPFHKVGIAHLACGLIRPKDRAGFISVLDRISESDMRRLFSRAAELGCGIELNHSDMSFKDEEADSVLRMFRIAKECGCKFYLGSDAHHPSTFASTDRIFSRAIDLLGLEESDKFSF